jgi:hypothetical protein
LAESDALLVLLLVEIVGLRFFHKRLGLRTAANQEANPDQQSQRPHVRPLSLPTRYGMLPYLSRQRFSNPKTGAHPVRLARVNPGHHLFQSLALSPPQNSCPESVLHQHPNLPRVIFQRHGSHSRDRFDFINPIFSGHNFYHADLSQSLLDLLDLLLILIIEDPVEKT